MTVHESQLLTPQQSCERFAAAVIECAIEDVVRFSKAGVLVNGKVNTAHQIFRTKKQYNAETFEKVSGANPRDVYALLRFFDDELKTWLKIAGIEVAARTIKRAVINGNVSLRSV